MIFKHVCEGEVQDAVVNWCSHIWRVVIRVSPNRKFYLRWAPKGLEAFWATRSGR